MKAFLIFVFGMFLIPTAAFADRGGVDSYVTKSIEESYAMKRDGRMERAMEEGRANKAAFEALKQRRFPEPTATGTLQRPRR